MMQQMTILGIEAMSGTGKTSGKAYAIGRVHTSAQLAAPMEGGVAKGTMGTTYECDPILVRKIAHLPLPLTCNVDVQSQMKFGKREDFIADIAPSEVVKRAA